MFDLDAAVAETAGEPFVFTWGGQGFTLQPLLERDIEDQLDLLVQVEAVNQADPDPATLLQIIRRVVGEETLAAMRAARPLGAAALMALLRQWIAQQGETLGKSSASPDSSASTAQQ